MSTLSVMQHHDAITGTSTQKVSNDYMRIIKEAKEEDHPIYSQVITDVVKIQGLYFVSKA